MTGVGAMEGIGRYLAEGLCEAGAEVVLINRSERCSRCATIFGKRATPFTA